MIREIHRLVLHGPEPRASALLPAMPSERLRYPHRSVSIRVDQYWIDNICRFVWDHAVTATY